MVIETHRYGRTVKSLAEGSSIWHKFPANKEISSFWYILRFYFFKYFGKASGMLLVDTSNTHWLRLYFKPLCIQFVRFATLYSYVALDTFIRHTIVNILDDLERGHSSVT